MKETPYSTTMEIQPSYKLARKELSMQKLSSACKIRNKRLYFRRYLQGNNELIFKIQQKSKMIYYESPELLASRAQVHCLPRALFFC